MIIVTVLLFIGLASALLPGLYKKHWYRELAAVAAILAVDLFLFSWLAWGRNLPQMNTAITNLIKTWF